MDLLERVSAGGRGRLLLAGSGVALAAALGLPGSALGADTAFAGCDKPFDPYAVSASILSSCGLKTFPLQSQTATSDGGSAYNYDVFGTRVSFMVPRAGFDPRTASAGELALYGIPPRPPDSEQAKQATWDEAVSKLSFVKPPSYLATSRVKSAINTYNWSGFLDAGGVEAFSEAKGVYTEPIDHGTSCLNNSATFWVGLGGVNTTNLAQDGTAINTPTLGQYQAWKEILPAPTIPVNLYATPGQSFKAVTHWLGSEFQFVLYNLYTGQAQTIDVNTTSYDGSTSEFIGERPTYQGAYTNLTNFGQLSWSTAETNGSPLQDFSYSAINMYGLSGTGDPMASPTTYPGSDGGFTDTWKNCS